MLQQSLGGQCSDLTEKLAGNDLSCAHEMIHWGGCRDPSIQVGDWPNWGTFSRLVAPLPSFPYAAVRAVVVRWSVAVTWSIGTRARMVVPSCGFE